MIPKQKQEFIKDALWISYTGLKDFLKCPRSFYLKNRYKDPKSGYKIQITSPYLTLGSLVHDAVKWYLETNRTAGEDEVVAQFRNHWLKYRGKRGGFTSREIEGEFGKRGLSMLDNFCKNATNLEKNVPNYGFLKFTLAPKIVLNGRLDFLGELPDGTLHVLDFKTGAKDEEDSTQLHTYAILAEANLERKVSKASFWYLDREDAPREIVLDPLEPKLTWLKEKALELKKAIQADSWVCIKDQLCRDCKDYQAIIDGKGQFQFSDYRYKKDVYYLST